MTVLPSAPIVISLSPWWIGLRAFFNSVIVAGILYLVHYLVVKIALLILFPKVSLLLQIVLIVVLALLLLLTLLTLVVATFQIAGLWHLFFISRKMKIVVESGGFRLQREGVTEPIFNYSWTEVSEFSPSGKRSVGFDDLKVANPEYPDDSSSYLQDFAQYSSKELAALLNQYRNTYRAASTDNE